MFSYVDEGLLCKILILRYISGWYSWISVCTLISESDKKVRGHMDVPENRSLN